MVPVVIKIRQAPDFHACFLKPFLKIPVRKFCVHLQKKVEAGILLVNCQFPCVFPGLQSGNQIVSLLFIELSHPVNVLFKISPA